MNNQKGIVAALLALAFTSLLILGWVVYGTMQRAGEAQTGDINGGANARACTVTQVGVKVVGKDIPTTLSATTSLRSFLFVQPVGTTTLALAFNGASASSTTNTTQAYSWLVSTQASTGTSTPTFSAGKDTDFKYTGGVSAISLNGTSTALVTECVYSN